MTVAVKHLEGQLIAHMRWIQGKIRKGADTVLQADLIANRLNRILQRLAYLISNFRLNHLLALIDNLLCQLPLMHFLALGLASSST